jgi:hypothetical protein
MNTDSLLQEILTRLEDSQGQPVMFSWDEVKGWPEGTLESLKAAGMLRRAPHAKSLECDGCEENCNMPVHVFPAEGKRPARAFISCDKRDDVSRVPVDMRRLEQWQITGGLLAKAVARLLGFMEPPQEDTAGKEWKLGLLKDNEQQGEVKLAIENGVSLTVAHQNIPLFNVLALNQRGLKADKDALLRLAEAPTRQPVSGMGSPEWRKQTAKAAANARHNQPGGSRDKQQRIREIWATGKYSSRDICAEQECAAMDMSYSAARKALRNTPDPSAPSRC